MSARATARERRHQLKASLSRALRRALHDHDVDQLELARAAGVGPSLVQRWADREADATLTLADVVLAAHVHAEHGPALAVDLLDWAASQIGSGYLVAPRREGSQPASWWSLLSHSLDAAARWQRELADALCPRGAGGSDLTTGEIEALEDKLVELELVVSSARAMLRAEKSSRAPTATTSPTATSPTDGARDPRPRSGRVTHLCPKERP